MAKKIGIITFHRANNYGAVLQCYALQKTLKKLGYNPMVIDYRQPVIERAYNPVRLDILMKGFFRPRLLAGYLLKVFPERLKRAIRYNKFRKEYIICTQPVTDIQKMPQDFDIYIIGSDQMWGLHCTGDKIDKLYFGAFHHPKESKIYGYAISSNLQSIETVGCDKLIKYVNNFETLSFRESAIQQVVKNLTGTEGRVDVDPTLLLETSEWEKLVNKRLINERYLLTYFLHDDATNLDFQKKVKEFAHKHGYKLVNVFDIAYAPDEFLSAIKYASFVLTTSFHATVFSLHFRREFYSINSKDGKEIRYANLLSLLSLENRFIDANNLLSINVNPIDYTSIKEKISNLCKASLSYLKTL